MSTIQTYKYEGSLHEISECNDDKATPELFTHVHVIIVDVCQC